MGPRIRVVSGGSTFSGCLSIGLAHENIMPLLHGTRPRAACLATQPWLVCNFLQRGNLQRECDIKHA